MVQLHHPDTQTELARLGAQLLVVSFAPVEELTAWVPFFQTHYLDKFFKERGRRCPDEVFARTRFVSDAELGAYRAYGLGRHTLWKAYGPKIVWRYLHFMAQGKPLRMPNGDTLQKGGDFVINREGRLTLSHIGRDQSARPEVATILTALNS